MEHFYQDITGWFDFAEIYSAFVQTAPNPSHFVEVGAWYGKSTAYLAVEIINSKKNIRLDVVDHWKGSWEHQEDGIAPDQKLIEKGSIYEEFLKNLEPARSAINPICEDSVTASRRYADGSLDLVFLDASHTYDDVSKDLQVWYPKLRSRGIFAGHDFTMSWPGLVRAITEFPYFERSKIIKADKCWVYHKD